MGRRILPRAYRELKGDLLVGTLRFAYPTVSAISERMNRQRAEDHGRNDC
jgi:hypothetical protein